MIDKPKWSQLTSHQQLAHVPLHPETTVCEIADYVDALTSPFGQDKANFTWSIEAKPNMIMYVLKVHAQRYPK